MWSVKFAVAAAAGRIEARGVLGTPKERQMGAYPAPAICLSVTHWYITSRMRQMGFSQLELHVPWQGAIQVHLGLVFSFVDDCKQGC